MVAGTRKLRLAVLVSGGGTNLQALLDRAARGRLAAEIVVVASDRADAYGLERARRAGIPTHVVDYRAHLQAGAPVPLAGDPLCGISRDDLEELDRRQRILKHPDRDARLRYLAQLVSAESAMIRGLAPHGADYLCLAGFMRLVTPHLLSHYNRGPTDLRVLNIHPALLPAFPGRHGYDDTLAYGCRWGGVSVHFVDEGEDSGPVIAQAVYPIWPGDDLDTVRQRGLALEYELYAQCVEWLAAGHVKILPGPAARPRVTVADPAYRTIVTRWCEQALA
jgi:phosphoribosylglycinamide formyltransferase-1